MNMITNAACDNANEKKMQRHHIMDVNLYKLTIATYQKIVVTHRITMS